MRLEPVHYTVVAVDVAGSGFRDDVLQLRMRSDLRAIMAETLSRQGLDLAAVHHTDLGDGIRLIVSPRVSPTALLDPFVPNLAVALRQHRGVVCPAAGLRLRVAVHMGLLHRDASGWAGAPLVRCARMLDAAPVRRVLAVADRADLVLVVSELVYDSVVRHGYGLDPGTFRQQRIVEKETTAAVWVHVPGYQMPPDVGDLPRAVAEIEPATPSSPTNHDLSPLLGSAPLATVSSTNGAFSDVRAEQDPDGGVDGEPTPELVQWLAQRSGGVVARAERELARLADGGYLEQGHDGCWALATAVPALAERARRRLPAAVSSLVGRERDIARVADLLADRRLVTLTGPGGIGKTRLSLAVAIATADEFTEGAVFVSLAEATATELVVSAVARVLELPDGADEPLADLVIRALSGLDLLLVLDNFEHVLSAGPFVAALLAAAPGVRVLATSRQRLRLSGEQVYTVPPLPLPDLNHLPARPEDTTAALDASPALALFVARATEAVYGLTFTPDELRAAAEVCCRLDGLPLAIELAAANCGVLSPAQILAQLNERLDLPIAGPRDLPARQRTLQAAMDWSFALLDADDQEMLARLAIFAGGCPAEAIAAVCLPPDTTTDATIGILDKRLAGLVDRNLLGVHHTPNGTRYTMLETIRAYAAQRLAATATDDGLTRRHATYYAEFAARADHGLAGADGATWYTRVDREYLNLRAAHSRAMTDGDRITAARIVLGIRLYWIKGWRLRDGRDWHHQVLTTTADRPLPDDLRGRLLESAAFLSLKQGDHAAARSLAEESLQIARLLAAPNLIARALNVLGLLAQQTGDSHKARACFSECIAIKQARGDRDSVLAAARGNLSLTARFDGDLETARELLQHNIELTHENGNLRGMALDLITLADVYIDLGDAAAAQPLLTEAVELTRQIGDVCGEAYATHILGRLARLDGDQVEAYSRYATAIREYHRFGDRFAVLYTLNSFIELLSTVDPARTARMLGAVEAIRDHDGTPMTKHQRAIRNATLRSIRAALTEPELAAATATGRAMDLDALIMDALTVDPTGR